MKYFFIILLTFPISGCANFYLPTAQTNALSLFNTQDAREQELITEFRRENASLKFLSRNSYTCGNPSDRELSSIVSATDAAEWTKTERLRVKDITNQKVIKKVAKKGEKSRPKPTPPIDIAKYDDAHITELWTSSVGVIETYAKFIMAVGKSRDEALAYVDSFGAAAKSLAKAIPHVKVGTEAAIDASKALVRDLTDRSFQLQLNRYASLMDEPLTKSVNIVKYLYPAYQGKVQRAFKRWESCAFEKLAYIRDLPKGLLGPQFPIYYNVESGTELVNSYVAFDIKRASYKGTANFEEVLDKVIQENRKLTHPELTKEALVSSIQRASDEFNLAVTALNAVKNIDVTQKK